MFRFALYTTFKLEKYHLWNGQTESHTSTIDILRGMHTTEKLKELSLILLFNTDSSVLDWSNKHTSLVYKFNRYTSMKSEFNSIAKKIEDDLLVALFITEDKIWYILAYIYF